MNKDKIEVYMKKDEVDVVSLTTKDEGCRYVLSSDKSVVFYKETDYPYPMKQSDFNNVREIMDCGNAIIFFRNASNNSNNKEKYIKFVKGMNDIYPLCEKCEVEVNIANNDIYNINLTIDDKKYEISNDSFLLLDKEEGCFTSIEDNDFNYIKRVLNSNVKVVFSGCFMRSNLDTPINNKKYAEFVKNIDEIYEKQKVANQTRPLFSGDSKAKFDNLTA
ncbi:MAG: hypothetical protein N4A43_00505 [Alphaproteobacteria bacterium]|nr:hypothetical protein [Alphaproteobacteria bacterium]